MSIGALRGINPFQKAMAANMLGAQGVNSVQPINIFAGGNEQASRGIDKNESIFSAAKVQNGNVSGLNPFASVNQATQPVDKVTPAGLGRNYSNGLAPSDDLQNVYSGMYKGKPNFLNQIAIA